MHILFQASSTYIRNSNSLIIYTSWVKCCFFYLISYHRANVIFINCSIMLKARKIIAESCSMHGPGTLHHICRGAPSDIESENTGPTSCQEQKILRESYKFYVLEGWFHFSRLSLESTIRINWIQFNKLLLILYYIPGTELGV